MKPFDHLRQEEVKRIVQTYLAYLSDKMNLLSNPGILVSTRGYLAADNTLTVCNYNSHVFVDNISVFIDEYCSTCMGDYRCCITENQLNQLNIK